MTKGDELGKASQPRIEEVLGPLAGPIVRTVSDHGEATVSAVRDALEARSGRPHAYTTVMTVMARLHDRGLLDRTMRGRHYVYRTAAPEAQLIERLSGRAVDQLVARYGTAALRHFADRLQDLEPSIRADLMKLAAGRRKA
ncbi:MAG: BlaI/MecI/CopY family transcriptional regulator [Chloroflexi bacterium]|nr:BlaI/MecI/CopY family transcriptional regulator [Chloroflexota bacterium]